MFCLVIATIVLFFIPFRWLFMVYGVNKFTKRLRKPHYVDHNELLDFLSRVPSDRELVSLVDEMFMQQALQREYREPRGNSEDSRSSSRTATVNNNASGSAQSSSSKKKN